MTLRHLQIFACVCDTMNMTAAAQSLFLSQSAVSQAIAELERHYDVRLFERLSRKLYLTQAGEKLLRYARHMLGLHAEMEKNMKTLREHSLLRVGASVTIDASVLPQLVASFLRQYPNTRVEVMENNTHRIEQLLLHDGIDLALVEGEISSPEIVALPFMQDELVLICGKSHRFSKRKQIDPQEMETENFIVREKGSGTRQTFETVMKEHELSWTPAWTCNNADTIKMAVAEGLGISIISRRSVVYEIASGRLFEIPVTGLCFMRVFKKIYHKGKYLTDAMNRFLEFCSWEHDLKPTSLPA